MTTQQDVGAPVELPTAQEVGARDIAIVGAGYVGIPLAHVFCDAGRSVVLLDVDSPRVAALNRGESPVEDVPSEQLGRLVGDGLVATTDYDVLREAGAILIALPTPLSKQREPDLSILLGAAREISTRLRPVISSCSSRRRTRERRLRS